MDYAKGLLKAVQVFKLPGVTQAEVVPAETAKTEAAAKEQIPEIVMSTKQKVAS